jgi:predicted ATPase
VFVTLELKNIGMIKEANVKIDGLTVIAGENDTGKSTVGKALFSILECSLEYATNTNFILKSIFQEKDILINSSISLVTDKNTKFFLTMNEEGNLKSGVNNLEDFPERGIFIETPIIWNMQEFFNSLVQIESRLKSKGDTTDIPYPYLMKDLHYKLQTKRPINNSFIFPSESIKDIINGEFIKNKQTNDYRFYKGDSSYNLINVATGIKYFGLIQVLIDNYQLDTESILILDEPEVHLHPKWQLEMAQIIVELVKNGVKILVNSHSPYMIEALERYAEKEEVIVDFYLAENGIIDKIDNNNSKTLAKIFNKLSAPYETFNKMDSETLKGG